MTALSAPTRAPIFVLGAGHDEKRASVEAGHTRRDGFAHAGVLRYTY